MTDWKALIDIYELHLRQGRADLVVRSLQGRGFGRIPRQWILPLANIARRTGLSSLGLRLLSPVVMPKTGQTATGPEIAEYAVLLQKIGAIEESSRMLALIDRERVPESSLYRAFYHFHRWDPAAAADNSGSICFAICPIMRA
ncbi:MAG: hypothetical protein HC902_13335 [Calothrix sp. SM1_5_4]|nr:hypothetical protein [Calothrix sp. SM1_5_4]